MYQCIIIITEVYESVARNSTHEWADILKYVGGIETEKANWFLNWYACMHAVLYALSSCRVLFYPLASGTLLKWFFF